MNGAQPTYKEDNNVITVEIACFEIPPFLHENSILDEIEYKLN